VKPSQEHKVILIVDGHSSHKHVDVLSSAKENAIMMLCLPPHCTHRLHPLDVPFYGPMKTYYNHKVSKWLKANPGRTVTLYQITSLLSTAYGKAATIANAQSGFRKTGNWSVNADMGCLKTSCLLLQRPPIGLSENQMETSVGIQHQVRMSYVLLQLLMQNKLKNQLFHAQIKKTPIRTFRP
jgi:hypothetical protein